MYRKTITVSLIALALFLLLKVLWVSVLYVGGDQLLDGYAKEDLLHRRAFLRGAITIRHEERPSSQSLLPSRFQGEWALLSCSMYSMALCNLAFLYPDLREELAQEIQALIGRVLQKSYRQFDIDAWHEDPLDSLLSENGHLWYLGHLNLMLTCYRLTGGDTRYDTLTHRISEALARRINLDAAMIAQTYPGERYIPDNSVVLASLKNHDIAFGTQYRQLISKWRLSAEEKLIRNDTGTLVFAISPGAKLRSQSRSSGVAFSLLYLFHADPEFCGQQYSKLKRAFGAWFLPAVGRFPGAGALKENPDGAWKGDIDSGPVIFGFSPAGTGFGVGCTRAAGDRAFLSQMLVTAEIVGCSIDWNGQRHYLLAPLVGEAIMLASKTATPWDGRFVRN